MACTLALSLLMAGLSGAQDSALERVKSESARLREEPAPPGLDFWNGLKAARNRASRLHLAIRDWIESLLPNSKAAVDAAIPFLSARLDADLRRSGVIGSSSIGNDFKPGLVTGIRLLRPSGQPDSMVVIAGVGIPCGSDDVVYVYDYSQGAPLRVLESHGTRGHDEVFSDIYFSKRDGAGARLLLVLRRAAQCASTWSLLSYDLFRLSGAPNRAMQIFGGQHGIWFGADEPYQVRLAPHESLMEVRDRSIDVGIHNRPHVLRYSVAGERVERVDPVALQPQDFVDEWPTRPWSEMASRSASERDNLKKWHDLLAGDVVSGHFTIVQACAEKRGQWQVGVSLGWIRGKQLPEALELYFLVQQLEQYRFQMTGISFARQDGCPGESRRNLESPSLFPARETKD